MRVRGLLIVAVATLAGLPALAANGDPGAFQPKLVAGPADGTVLAKLDLSMSDAFKVVPFDRYAASALRFGSYRGDFRTSLLIDVVARGGDDGAALQVVGVRYNKVSGASVLYRRESRISEAAYRALRDRIVGIVATQLQSPETDPARHELVSCPDGFADLFEYSSGGALKTSLSRGGGCSDTDITAQAGALMLQAATDATGPLPQ